MNEWIVFWTTSKKSVWFTRSKVFNCCVRLVDGLGDCYWMPIEIYFLFIFFLLRFSGGESVSYRCSGAIIFIRNDCYKYDNNNGNKHFKRVAESQKKLQLKLICVENALYWNRPTLNRIRLNTRMCTIQFVHILCIFLFTSYTVYGKMRNSQRTGK